QGAGSLPVTNVSWNEAVAFCQEMNANRKEHLPSGMVFNLPTEAQWKHAARAGTTTAYYFGNDAEGLDAHANFGKERSQFIESGLSGLGLLGATEDPSPFKVGPISEPGGTLLGGKPKLEPATSVQSKASKLNEPLSLLEEFKTTPAEESEPESEEKDIETLIIALFGSTLSREVPANAKREPQSLPIPDNTPFRPVGQHLPNPWLLYDVYGNAAEWCLIDKDSEALVPGPRALGGSVFSSATQCRTGGVLMFATSESQYPDVGFRIVISQDFSSRENP
ncbi:MAG: SUMF1/EgtB/PvdO family nonheme iron enzyme, partial [Verrucomicrobiota bacterium]